MSEGGNCARDPSAGAVQADFSTGRLPDRDRDRNARNIVTIDLVQTPRSAYGTYGSSSWRSAPGR